MSEIHMDNDSVPLIPKSGDVLYSPFHLRVDYGITGIKIINKDTFQIIFPTEEKEKDTMDFMLENVPEFLGALENSLRRFADKINDFADKNFYKE